MSMVTEHAQALDPQAALVVPATAFVPCPASAGFKQTRVAKCPACPQFRGFVDTDPKAGPSVDFIARYRVFCGHPIARRMAHVETD